ncbi:MAG: hypothetical protein H0V79_08695 [Actinobacteria bacterium]|nr:hypothetical protein [Actinomycetota bacterium]
MAPIDPLGAALGGAPLVRDAVHAIRGRDEVAALIRLVEREARSSSELQTAERTRAADRVAELGIDPTVVGCLHGYLQGREAEIKPRLRRRLEELLKGEEWVSLAKVVDVVIRATTANVHRAVKEEREAGHVDHLVTRQAGAAGVEEVKQHISAELASLGSGEQPVVRSARPDGVPTSGVGSAWATADVERLLDRLETDDADGAASLRRGWAARGDVGIAELVRTPQSWLEEGSAEVWNTAGQIAHRFARYGEAETAYLRAADHPSVRDRVRQLSRAAMAAKGAEEEARSAELLNLARAIDAGHPSVVIAEARELDDPREALARLEEVHPLDDPQRSELEWLRCMLYRMLGDDEAAEAAIAAAESAYPGSLGVAEQSAALTLARERRRAVADEPHEREALAEAAATFGKLRAELLLLEDLPGGAHLAAQAVEALVLLNELSKASRLLEEVAERPAEYLDARAAAALGQAALEAQRPDLTLIFVPDDREEEHRLLRADAALLQDGRTGSSQAVETLRQLLNSSNEAVAKRAAFALLQAAAFDEGVEWNERAAAVVGDEQAWTLALLEAQRARARGDTSTAERLLAPHSGRSVVMRSLIDLAARDAEQNGDWMKALRLSDALLARDAAQDDDRLRHASLIFRNGGSDQAVSEFLALARDARRSRTPRRRAYRGAAEILEERNDYGQLESVTDEWIRFATEDVDAGWLRLFSLVRRSLVERALERWREEELPVQTEQQALLLAQIFSLAAPPGEAVAEIARLSDQFERPERLEFALINVGLRQRGAELDEALAARIRKTSEEFPDRFPDSTLIRAFSIDSDDAAESFAEIVREQQGDRAHLLRDLSEKVGSGTAAVAVLAGAAGRGVGEIWLRLEALPLAYGDSPLTEIERGDAADALAGAAAVWDPAALFVVGGMEVELRDLLRAALPASVIVQAALDEAAADGGAPRRETHEEVAVEPQTGELRWLEWPQEQVLREHARVDGTLALARGFPAPTLPPPSTDEDPALARMLEDDLPSAWVTWIESFVVARRLELPLFSDDRYVRQAARQYGLRSFGTLALLDVLVDQGRIDQSLRRRARRRLHHSRAWGLDPSVDELAEWTAPNRFRLSLALKVWFLDSCAWRADPLGMTDRVLAFLAVVHARAPEDFGKWVARAVDASRQGLPHLGEAQDRVLLAVALDPVSETPRVSDACLNALVDALRRIPFFLRAGRRSDVLMDAINLYLEATAEEGEEVQAVVFRRLIVRLAREDRDQAIRTFVRDPSPTDPASDVGQHLVTRAIADRSAPAEGE